MRERIAAIPRTRRILFLVVFLVAFLLICTALARTFGGGGGTDTPPASTDIAEKPTAPTDEETAEATVEDPNNLTPSPDSSETTVPPAPDDGTPTTDDTNPIDPTPTIDTVEGTATSTTVAVPTDTPDANEDTDPTPTSVLEESTPSSAPDTPVPAPTATVIKEVPATGGIFEGTNASLLTKLGIITLLLLVLGSVRRLRQQ